MDEDMIDIEKYFSPVKHWKQNEGWIEGFAKEKWQKHTFWCPVCLIKIIWKKICNTLSLT